jgi:hypothetical protein
MISMEDLYLSIHMINRIDFHESFLSSIENVPHLVRALEEASMNEPSFRRLPLGEAEKGGVMMPRQDGRSCLSLRTPSSLVWPLAPHPHETYGFLYDIYLYIYTISIYIYISIDTPHETIYI